MPNQLEHVDPSSWLGDGAGFAPDASYGLTESQRGAKRSNLYDNVDTAPEMKKMKKVATVLQESDDQLKNRIEKHVTAFTTLLDGTGFPINIYNKKSLLFFLSHRCQVSKFFFHQNNSHERNSSLLLSRQKITIKGYFLISLIYSFFTDGCFRCITRIPYGIL